MAVEQSRKFAGKIELKLKVPLNSSDDLSTAYTPGVAQVCREIAADEKESFNLTWRKNSIAVLTDGSAILGLGNLGPAAAMPVMEGKAAIFKKFGNVDAVPICVSTQDPDEICFIAKNLQKTFGGINLEDISAPRCFEIEKRLSEDLEIPVFHDDQHGTAIVVLAGILNALKIVGKKLENCKIVFSGAGAGGISTARLLIAAGARNLILVDSRGAIYADRDNLNPAKESMCKFNRENLSGSLTKVLRGADIFVGLSAPNLLIADDIKTMNSDPIVFAMANPDPEILPDEAKRGGAAVVATGRSDFENQANNALVFPGIFRGVFDAGAREFSPEVFLIAARALADCVENPRPEEILPAVFDPNPHEKIAVAVRDFFRN